ncbi:MAG: tetratricopeptide repeat protein [Myxococcota bacterium]|jgi:hypothetical protein|nr:tetratricopeptide repeat protein [Myxococcota bacterium]
MMRRAANLCLVIAILVVVAAPANSSIRTYDEHLQIAWVLLQKKEYAAAALHYRAAAQRKPAALDPWLGLAAAHLGLNEPERALQAGHRALAIDPTSYWAKLRNAYAFYLLGDYAAAQNLYIGLVEQNPQDAEALLGLGTSRLRQGDAQGEADCEKAGVLLGPDPRVAECLALRRAKAASWTATAGATYLWYSDPWNNNGMFGASCSSAVTLRSGVGFWLGASYGLTLLRYQTSDFTQASPGGGVFFLRHGWSVGAYFAWIGSGDESVHGAFVLGGHGGYEGKRVGLQVDGNWSHYPDFSTGQVESRLTVIPARMVRVWAGPRLIALAAGRPPVSSRSTSASFLWSGFLGVELLPVKALEISLRGFYGPHAYFVEEYGLSVWSSSDRFFAGFDVELAITIVPSLRVLVGWRHHFGDRQQGRAHEFALYGPSLGLGAVF